MIKFALASDHGGFELKSQLVDYLNTKGYEVNDLGTNSETESVSYSDYGHKLGTHIENNSEVIGIGICGTGLGISYALNRHKGIRAARVVSVEDAELAKLHNNANVLVFGGRQTNKDEAIAMIEKFIETEFEGGRHQTRIDGIEL